MRRLRRWIWNVLIAMDQFWNAVLGGDPDETISTRARRARDQGRRWGRTLCAILDRIDPAHCDEARE